MNSIQILYTFLFCFFSFYLTSQCPPGDVTLSSQTDVNTFATNYPSCDTIQGILTIGYQSGNDVSDITDLSGLSNLTAVKGNFYIRNNPNLTTLDGLHNFTTAGVGDFSNHTGVFFVIENNSSLTSLMGLDALNYCNGIFTIAQNNSLVNLEGLESLETLTFGDTINYLNIVGNENLVDLSGLDHLREVSFLTIAQNNNLTSLSGLESLVTVYWLSLESNPVLVSLAALNHDVEITSYLSILSNAQLSTCGVRAVCQHILNNGEADLAANADGCNDFSQVNCDDLGVSGMIFYDYNQNKIKEPYEGVPFAQAVNVLPENVNLSPSNQGKYFLFGDEGTSYTLDWIDDPAWTLTTDFQTYQVIYSQGLASNENKDFGLFPTFISHDFSVNIASEQPRCDTEVVFKITTQNQGTFIENGVVEIVYDELFDFISTSLTPTSIDLINRTLSFGFNNLYPFAVQEFEIIFLMPDASAIGEEASVQGNVRRGDNGVLIDAAMYNYSSTMGCAFDPNDKLVFPVGEGDEHYTLKDEKLTYTLRFQNTGNLDAINIEIRDTLNNDLDWLTFKVLNSSHEVFTSRTDEGAISFLFQNIYLPAESIDEARSQGFVTYEIAPLTNLTDFTIIENTGYIYFDSNPPIVTNTTFNTLVELIPTAVNNLASASISIYPNPAFNHFTVTMDSQTILYQVSVYNHLGQLLTSSKTAFNDISHLVNGLYLIQVETNQGINLGKLVLGR